MRKGEREIRTRGEIDAILREARVLRLGLSQEDRPYVVPVNFGYRDGRIYFHGAAEGRKIDAIRANPRVCFEVEGAVEVAPAPVACGWTTYYESVVGFGRARILEDPQEKARGLDAVMVHHGGDTGGYPPEVLERTAVVEIEISSVTGKRHGR